MSASSPGFGIYIHWPFCRSKCPYCDFNSHVRERIDHARWRSALLAELEHYARDTEGRTVTSIFFGGGTPSLMEPETVAALIQRVRGLWPVADDVEITLEANPTSAEIDRALAFAAGHISLYQLTIEPGTQFEQAVARGDFCVLDEESAAELYEATVARLGAAGPS